MGELYTILNFMYDGKNYLQSYIKSHFKSQIISEALRRKYIEEVVDNTSGNDLWENKYYVITRAGKNAFDSESYKLPYVEIP